MDPLLVILACLTGYLLGCISFARIVAGRVAPEVDVTRIVQPLKGSDLAFEDDAVSASTVMLNVGTRYGVVTGLLDMLKAALPTLVFRLLAPDQPYFLVASAMAVVGHDWPIYYRFRGGRGEAAIYGSMLVIDPLGVLACLLAAIVLGWLFGQVRLVRWSGMLLFIPWLWFRTGDPAFLVYAVIVNILFWFTMRNELRQHYLFQKRGVFRNQEELSKFMDMGSGLGRFLDRYSLPALLRLR